MSSLPPSTVAPGDSASSSGKKKKPGKAERAVRRSQVGSVPGQAASAAKASAFASGSDFPAPQPGRFPVVFQTGAGEPSRDLDISLNGDPILANLAEFPSRFTMNAKYSEFKAHAEITDAEFATDISVSALLRLAQQVVHSHVNMGFPQGDFAPVSSSDVRLPASVSAYVSQFGEFSVPALGTRFLLSGYAETVKRLVWLANQMANRRDGNPRLLERFWLPVTARDPVFKLIVADRLNNLLSSAGVSVAVKELEDGLLSGAVPDAFENVKEAIGETPGVGETDKRDRFDFLFKSYADVGVFTTAFTTTDNTASLLELDLLWSTPSAGHLDWQFNVKTAFTEMADRWAKVSTTYAQFFEMSSSLTNRSSASGSQAQMAIVSDVDTVAIVKTHLALSAPEFSLAACFPATAVFSGGLSRRVVVTTPLSVKQRATEFCQLDWR
jgi:hypothetical protein